MVNIRELANGSIAATTVVSHSFDAVGKTSNQIVGAISIIVIVFDTLNFINKKKDVTHKE
jgi:hypothetical protein